MTGSLLAMPSTEHEVPLAMVRNQPALVPTILRTVFGLDMPGDAHSATITSESFAGLNPAELRCDATVLAGVAAAIDVPTRDEKTKETAELYHDYLVSQLSESARKLLEEIAKTAGYEWQSDFAKSHIAKGEAIGEAKMLLLMLEARGGGAVQCLHNRYGKRP